MTIPPEISKRALARVISQFAYEFQLGGEEYKSNSDSNVDEYAEETINNTIDSSDMPEDPDALMKRMKTFIRMYAHPLRAKYSNEQLADIIHSYAGYTMDMIKKLMTIGSEPEDQKLYDVLDI